MPKRSLTVGEILAWADAFHARRGRYPQLNDGPAGHDGLTWSAVSQALKRGYRGLPGGATLARLLCDRRGVRHRTYPPPLTRAQILRWADAHHRAAGAWPGHDSGSIPGTQQETWLAVESALRGGSRGLRGRSSLARLLAARRRVRNHTALPPLSPAKILAWADRHHARTGRWPSGSDGPVAGERGEAWRAVDAALLLGHRQLPPGGSLARLLAEHRGVRNPHAVPRLSAGQVLSWADAHKARTGAWPTEAGGPVAESPDDTWCAVNAALAAGTRGLDGGDTLARLLARHRGKRHPAALPPLAPERIRAWGLAYRRRRGKWPNRQPGRFPRRRGRRGWRSARHWSGASGDCPAGCPWRGCSRSRRINRDPVRAAGFARACRTTAPVRRASGICLRVGRARARLGAPNECREGRLTRATTRWRGHTYRGPFR